ncbi:MAG TPA: VanW family protein [Clostridia bacterium]|nr:VanW family protein [Clostridia bacterium]
MGAPLSVDKKPVKKISIIAIVFVFIAIICTGLYIWLFNSSKIFPGVFINDINVGGLTPEKARPEIDKKLKKRLDEFVIQLIYGHNSWELTSGNIDLRYLLDDSIEKAYKLGREGNCFYRMKTVLNLRKNPQTIKLIQSYDLSKVESKINEISKTIDKLPTDAKIERKNGNFIVTKEVLGIETDKEVLKYSISTAINNFKSISIDIGTRDTEPKIKGEDLDSVKDLIGESVTVFNTGDKGRTENIKIAANNINDTILMPGEEFSFNDSTGPRDAKSGYKEASIIMDGEFVTGIGGGVCQVSTTLYRAALRSDMEITSRQNHGLPISYVPMGQDATVVYGYIDLKFKNNKKYPVYVESLVRGGEIYMRLYSKKTDDIHINLKSEILEVIEPKMQTKKDANMYLWERKVSKSGRKGYRAATYKVYLQGGQEVKRELVSKDYYPSRNGIIIEGTKQE